MSEQDLVVNSRLRLIFVSLVLIGISVYVLRHVDESVYLSVGVLTLIVLICILFTFPLKTTINQSGIEIRRLAGRRLIKRSDVTEWSFLHGTEGD